MFKSGLIGKAPPLRRVAWSRISEPGAYVEVASGRLYRITPQDLIHNAARLPGDGHAPEREFVRVSTDPFIFSLGARLICAEHDIQPNF